MIKLHCTKKLSAKLDIDANGILPQAHRTPVRVEGSNLVKYSYNLYTSLIRS